MKFFVGNQTNKVDKKGRVSVPASFRAAVSNSAFQGVVLFPSIMHDAIEACTIERFERLVAEVDTLDPYSEERQVLSEVLFGMSEQLAWDTEGRFGVPSALAAHAGISDAAKFVGKATHFEIWNPAAHGEDTSDVLARAREKKLALPWGRAAGLSASKGGDE